MNNVESRHSELDLCNRSNLRKFILDHLAQEEERSRTKHGHPDFKNILPDLTEKITNFLFPKMPLPTKGMDLPFYREVNLIILEAIKLKGGTAFAANTWAGILLNAILNNR